MLAADAAVIKEDSKDKGGAAAARSKLRTRRPRLHFVQVGERPLEYLTLQWYFHRPDGRDSQGQECVASPQGGGDELSVLRHCFSPGEVELDGAREPPAVDAAGGAGAQPVGVDEARGHCQGQGHSLAAVAAGDDAVLAEHPRRASGFADQLQEPPHVPAPEGLLLLEYAFVFCEVMEGAEHCAVAVFRAELRDGFEVLGFGNASQYRLAEVLCDVPHFGCHCGVVGGEGCVAVPAVDYCHL